MSYRLDAILQTTVRSRNNAVICGAGRGDGVSDNMEFETKRTRQEGVGGQIVFVSLEFAVFPKEPVCLDRNNTHVFAQR